jgi:urea transport system permease protein
VLLFGAIGVCRWILGTKLGRLLLAMRDNEERVRFSGYDVASVKVFVFVVAAGLAAVGGAMFTLQVGFMSPSFVGIVPSIEMVVFAAVGGRDSLVGAVYGSLVVNWSKTYFSEKFPQLWLVLMGALFIGVVKVFPKGLAGLYDSHGRAWLAAARDRIGRLLLPARTFSPAQPLPPAGAVTAVPAVSSERHEP